MLAERSRINVNDLQSPLFIHPSGGLASSGQGEKLVITTTNPGYEQCKLLHPLQETSALFKLQSQTC